MQGRHILDGLFILNEIAAWCKAKKEKAYVFKVDFQKAYDSVRWDVIDEILKNFGFGWRSYGSQAGRSTFSILAMERLYIMIQRVMDRGTHQGLRIGENMTRLNSWKYVFDKVTSKLFNYKAKTLSIGGRLTLIKSLLGAIPTFYMSLFKAPGGVLKNIEALRNRFFLGADENEKKMMWVAWKTVLSDVVIRINNLLYCFYFVTALFDVVVADEDLSQFDACGSVVDVYIPFKKSKAGKRFAFIRFIKVSNMERLIENLCTIWIGSFHLYASVARFNRDSTKNGSSNTKTQNHKQSSNPGSFSMKAGKSSGSFASILKNGGPVHPTNSSPALVLDDSCLKVCDFNNSLMCQVKDVTVIPNLYIILKEEGFHSTSISYLGGLWVLIKFDTVDALEKFRIHVGIGSWFTSINQPSNSFVSNERIVWISIEGLPTNAWTINTFLKIAQKWGEMIVWDDSEEKYLSRKHICLKTKVHVIINENFKVIIKGVVYWIRAKVLDAWVLKFSNETDDSSSDEDGSEDDFNDAAHESSNEYVFETHGIQNVVSSDDNGNQVHVKENSASSDPFNIYPILRKKGNINPNSKDSDPPFPPGFTPVNAHLSNDEGSASINNSQHSSSGKKSDHNLNTVPSTSYLNKTSGSILDAMDDIVKIGQTMGFNMDGCLKNIEAIISVQGDPSMGWRTVVMGDFNEVRTEQERCGSFFNSLGAHAFNNFISSAGLIDIPLEGYSFTWAHKSATKMSKLDCKRSHLSIRGILHNGDWIDDPTRVKDEFFNHFSKQFSDPSPNRITLDHLFHNRLSVDQVAELERNLSNAKIKNTIWDCGTNKSPGPDGYTFEFFRKFWNIMENDIVDAVIQFISTCSFPPGCNSNFIALIPKIHDAKVIKDFRPISLIGSIYKVIARILANRLRTVILFLIDKVQTAFRRWIAGCLNSAKGSVLVNGSPTAEFKFHRGLKQGDPLSPFLFILVMKSLHRSFSKVLEEGLYKGIYINNSLLLSHLFYADDAVFVAEWNRSNISTIVRVLKCFHIALGLKINLSKSKLSGIGVSKREIDEAAAIVGCSTLSLPFQYLGVKIGAPMSRIKSWKEVIEKVVSRLSKWKIQTLSSGGRLTLIKSVLNALPLYYMSLFKAPKAILKAIESLRSNLFNGVSKDGRKMVMVRWDKIMASKSKGRLDVSSLFASNRALLFKWIWRLHSNCSSIWATLIKEIHGGKDGITNFNLKISGSIWQELVREFLVLKDKGIDCFSFIKRKLGNGEETYFWNDLWIEENVLKISHPRMYALELRKDISVAEKLNLVSLDTSFRRNPRGGVEYEQFKSLVLLTSQVLFPNTLDRWYWSLEGSGIFRSILSVAS
uniref:Putative RNA-directed DNA polymerase, eukaryota, reverse transcriptase zinc-binding domain protein n=1 Tax=Tanacetum cinerariifolium TaxID=118510 RepID=A0A6L2LSW3_TANCI|nr:putative RNA-directed DNA polymerase, eukaryota, reverse transcriptase zinc-binding domain protein [Tanacetum cinerariifolium]